MPRLHLAPRFVLLGTVLLSSVSSYPHPDPPPLTFSKVSGPTARVAFGDVNGDGWLDTVTARNDGLGQLSVLKASDIGLGVLAVAPPGAGRDVRLADFNGDGVPDVLSNCYVALGSSACVARLFLGLGDGTFSEEPSFAALGIQGFGETIVAADFDNDADLDVFIPHYTFHSPLEQCHLLINDGAGRFVDVADAAGVSLRNRPLPLRPEGAQAADLDGDGWIDLYVAGHVFFNNHDGTFTDRREELGLPELFDEGMKFLDWNNDGRLDIALHHPSSGPRLFEFDGARFQERLVFSPQTYSNSYGMNVHDLDNDGREDVITAGGALCDTIVHGNDGGVFLRIPAPGLDTLCNGLGSVAFGDIDRDGRIDVAHSDSLESAFLLNQTSNTNRSFTVEVLGAGGARNQHGRVVRASPSSAPQVLYTRVVDGGSGFLAQNQYPLLIGTPYLEPHLVQVAYQGGSVGFPIAPDSTARVFPDGTVLRTSPGPVPSLWVASARVVEGAAGSSALDFTLVLSAPTGVDVTVAYATSDGTAHAGADYAASAGTLTIPAGSATAVISVPVHGDLSAEPDETLSLALSDASNALLGNTLATGTIATDDLPVVSVTGAQVAEGDAGTTSLAFTVQLSAPSDQPVGVAYATSDGTAQAGTDYAGVSGALTIPAGSVTASVPVLVNGDTASEPDEAFTLVLSSPSNGLLGSATATGTIGNDDPPSVSVQAASTIEGNSGGVSLEFRIVLSGPAPQDVSVGYATSDGTAVAGSDYSAAAGTITIPAGAVTGTINVEVSGDEDAEPDETLTLTLADPTQGVLGAATAVGTILTDDLPSVGVVGGSVLEGSSGTSTIVFTVALTSPSSHDIEVDYVTSDGSAQAGSDYSAVGGVLQIPAGTSTATISVPVNGDIAAEPDESFSLVLFFSEPSGAVLGTASAAGMILNDDGTPYTADGIGVGRDSGDAIEWYLRTSLATTGLGTNDVPLILYGIAGDLAVTGDWDGDGVDTIGIYRPSEHAWYLRNSNTRGFNDVPAILYGTDGDVPLVGDWDGDGVDTIGIYRPSEHAWYLRNSNTSGANDIDAIRYGTDGDIPVIGDWDGDGVDTIGIYRPSEHAWYLRNSNTSGTNDVPAILYGADGDVPLSGDWNGDGLASIGVYRPSEHTWYLRNSNTTGSNDVPALLYGLTHDTPLTGRWVPPPPSGSGGSE